MGRPTWMVGCIRDCSISIALPWAKAGVAVSQSQIKRVVLLHRPVNHRDRPGGVLKSSANHKGGPGGAGETFVIVMPATPQVSSGSTTIRRPVQPTQTTSANP